MKDTLGPTENTEHIKFGASHPRPEELDWNKGNGLIPAVIQDHKTRQVLMVGMMSEASLAKTLLEGWITFYSRSRQTLWTKGETSGNRLRLVTWAADCDHDCLLVEVEPLGPVCHRNTAHCFGDGALAATSPLILAALESRILERANGLSGTNPTNRAGTKESYTQKLLREGPKRCAQKVGEEGVEVALAAAAGDRTELVNEAADLVYHLAVALVSRGVAMEEVWAELGRRMDR